MAGISKEARESRKQAAILPRRSSLSSTVRISLDRFLIRLRHVAAYPVCAVYLHFTREMKDFRKFFILF